MDSISPKPKPDFQAQLTKILDNQEYPTNNTTPELQEKFLRHYSFGALVLNFFYFTAMKDKLMAWLSLLAGLIIFFTPLLFIFPIWARRRAYQTRDWQNFGQFEHAQRKWDRSALYLLVVMAIIFYIAFRAITPILLNGFRHINPNLDSSSGDYIQQLQQTEQDLQQTLGQ